MGLVVLLIILFLVFGGGWGIYGGYSGRGYGYSWGPLGVILVVLLLLYLFGGIHF